MREFLVKLLGGMPANERAGLSMDPQAARWEIPPVKDVAAFLRALPDLAPDGSYLFVEGTSTDEKIRSYLESHAEEPPAKIERGTIWPRSAVFCLKVERLALEGLAALAEQCAAPELADHLHVYSDGRVVLSWWDFPFDPMCVSDRIPDERVHTFCTRFGVRAQVAPCSEVTTKPKCP